VFVVPSGGQPLADEPRRAEPVATAPGGPPGGNWRVKTPDGQTYGPVSKSELDLWVSEGRLTGDSQLLQEGASEWRWARDVYPVLSGAADYGTAAQGRPYPSPAAGFSGHLKPHRGTMILVLGILGLVACQVFGIPAWAMGRNDLAEMRAGRMDRSGEASTQAGMICGLISTILLIIGVLMVIPFILCAGIGAMR